MSYTSRFVVPGAVITCLSLAAACGGTSTTDEGAFGGDDGGTSTGQSSSGSPGSSGAGSSDGGGGGSACVPCLGDKDCGGGAYCVQVASDSYCAASCAAGATCSSDDACVMLTTSAGQQVSACVPRGGVCGIGSSSGGGSGSGSSGGGSSSSGGSGSSSGGNTCGTLVGPTTSAGCTSCSQSSSSCQANGCYGGWWCDTSTNKCQAAPSNCSGGGSSSSGGSGSSGSNGGSSSGGIDGGAPPTGSVGNTGGSVSRLLFAVVGDTRPPNTDDTSGYPTAIATKIFQDIQGMSPRPSFGVSTGDYMYATPGNGQAAPQLNLYIGARNNFTNVMFPAMGNHECTGYTASNCGSGNSDGVTENYTAFLNQMLQPLGQSNPYYSININSSSGAWTAKFVFVAANAWTSAQGSWLQSTLAQPTTYTFIMRHESASANTAPGVTPAEQIYAKYPYTLSIVGHTHTYEKSGAKEVIIGNGGAPLSGGNYGFGLIQQRSSDNAIMVDMIDYMSLQPDSSFHFAVNADGSAAPP